MKAAPLAASAGENPNNQLEGLNVSAFLIPVCRAAFSPEGPKAPTNSAPGWLSVEWATICICCWAVASLIPSLSLPPVLSLYTIEKAAVVRN